MRRTSGVGPKRQLLLAPLFGACIYDADDRCGPGQVLYEDVRCVCVEGSALTSDGCVPCGENEVVGASGCACAEGFVRPTPDAACEAAPAALGTACDVASTPCTDASYAHCQPVSGTSGYCTSSGCTSSADCESGYACDSSAAPSYCRRPPLGAGRPCTSAADCADSEALWCDTFMSQSCLVQGCSVSAQDCFEGSQCCDLSMFGVPEPLCLPAGSC